MALLSMFGMSVFQLYLFNDELNIIFIIGYISVGHVVMIKSQWFTDSRELLVQQQQQQQICLGLLKELISDQWCVLSCVGWCTYIKDLLLLISRSSPCSGGS